MMQFANPAEAGSVLPTLAIFGIVVQSFELCRSGVGKNAPLGMVVPIIGCSCC